MAFKERTPPSNDSEFRCLRREMAARIVRLRQRKAWNQATLAERGNFSRERLANWEAGRNLPPTELLTPLADALGVTVDELLHERSVIAELREKVAELQELLASVVQRSR